MVSAYFILVHRKILQVTLKCAFFLNGCFKTKEGLKNIMIDYGTIVAGDLSYVGGMLYSDLPWMSPLLGTPLLGHLRCFRKMNKRE